MTKDNRYFDKEKWKIDLKAGKLLRPCNKCGKMKKLNQLKFDNKHNLICKDCRRL